MNNLSQETVLVVDDSPESLGMLNIALNTQGYTALVALNGEQALAIAEKIKPDVVLLDAIMPGMDGFETCKALKQLIPSTPIIFMTGLTDVNDIVKGFEAGGCDYVTKPITPEEVIARIKNHINTAKLTLSAQDALRSLRAKYLFVLMKQGSDFLGQHLKYIKLLKKYQPSHNTPWAVMAESAIEKWLIRQIQSKPFKNSAILMKR